MKDAILLIVLGIIAFFVYTIYPLQVRTVYSQAYATLAPCKQVVTYRVGIVDPRFGISTSTLVDDLQEATNVWNDASGKKLFAYDQQNGVVTVDMLYDSRQEMTAQLKSLGVDLSGEQASYEEVKAKYAAAYQDYQNKKSSFQADDAAYQAKANAYEAEVRDWNAKGGAPPDIYAKLQSEKQGLQNDQTNLQNEQRSVNAAADNVNAIVVTLNTLAHALNLDVANYNTVGSSNGEQFEEGVYESSLGTRRITIFEYASPAKLIRVLAHELGHSLGLQHVQDASAIMYPLNQGTTLAAQPADIAELNSECNFSQ